MDRFKKVQSFLEKEGVKVRISNMTNYIRSKNLINIHYSYNKEKNGLYALLHEAGHYLQKQDITYNQNMYKDQLINNIDNDIKLSMFSFINELDAWDRGEQLAIDLDLEIDYIDFNKIKTEALLTYYLK